jgi:hypothetical protein
MRKEHFQEEDVARLLQMNHGLEEVILSWEALEDNYKRCIEGRMEQNQMFLNICNKLEIAYAIGRSFDPKFVETVEGEAEKHPVEERDDRFPDEECYLRYVGEQINRGRAPRKTGSGLTYSR